MVEVKNDLGILPAELLGISHSTLGHVAQEGSVGIVAGTLGYLEDDGALFFGSGLDDGLELLHVVEVEGRDSVTSLDGLGKHLAGVDEAEFLKAYHIWKNGFICVVESTSGRTAAP